MRGDYSVGRFPICVSSEQIVIRSWTDVRRHIYAKHMNAANSSMIHQLGDRLS